MTTMAPTEMVALVQEAVERTNARAGGRRVLHAPKLLHPPCGVKALRDSLRTPGDLFSAEKQAVVAELSWQLDLTIFDREVSHARTKSFVALGAARCRLSRQWPWPSWAGRSGSIMCAMGVLQGSAGNGSKAPAG